MLTDFETFQATSRTIKRISTIRDLHGYLQTVELDANVVATSIFQLANLWFDKTSRPTPFGRDADDPDVIAYNMLQETLPEKAILHMPLYPTDTRIAIAAAISQLDWENDDVHTLLEVLAVAVIADFDQVPDDRIQTNLVMLAATYTKSSHYNSQFLTWLGDRTVQHLDKFIGPEDLANIFHAFWEFRHLHQGLLDASREWLLPFLQAEGPVSVSPGALVSLGLGYATFDAGDLELYSLLLGAVGRSKQLKNLDGTTTGLLQVLYLLARQKGVEMPRKVTQAMMKVAKEDPQSIWRPCLAASFRPEYLQAIVEAGLPVDEFVARNMLMGQQLTDALEVLGLPAERNVKAGDYIMVHLRTQYKGDDVAIQICDKLCFQSQPYYRFKGTLLNEMRALELLGYRVVALPYFEWNRLETDADRAAYVAKRLSAAVDGVAPA